MANKNVIPLVGYLEQWCTNARLPLAVSLLRLKQKWEQARVSHYIPKYIHYLMAIIIHPNNTSMGASTIFVSFQVGGKTIPLSFIELYEFFPRRIRRCPAAWVRAFVTRVPMPDSLPLCQNLVSLLFRFRRQIFPNKKCGKRWWDERWQQ